MRGTIDESTGVGWKDQSVGTTVPHVAICCAGPGYSIKALNSHVGARRKAAVFIHSESLACRPVVHGGAV